MAGPLFTWTNGLGFVWVFQPLCVECLNNKIQVFKCEIFNVFLQTISYAAERIVGTGSFGIVFQVSSHRIMHKLPSHYAYLLLIG